ncbi:MAG: MarC family protein [Rhodospirillaceae bacterium]
MFDVFLTAFATFFALIGPLDVAAVFLVMTQNHPPAERNRQALRGCLVAALILLVFVFVGEALLHRFGISLAAFRIGGGILLLLIGIEMVFARISGGTGTTEEETAEAVAREDIAIFPLATPLLAGPGAMGATILLSAEASGDELHLALVIAAILLNLVIAYLLMRIAGPLSKFIGVTGGHVIARMMGILLVALGAQFMLDGVKGSGILG